MLQTGTYVLLFFVLLVAAVLLIVLQLTRLGYLVRTSIPDRPRRRMFLSSIAFFVTFLGVRLLVFFVVNGKGPFNWVMMGGRHIHHLVWGILILLLVGYGWLLDLGRGGGRLLGQDATSAPAVIASSSEGRMSTSSSPFSIAARPPLRNRA